MRLLADENFNNAILHGLQDRLPGVDVVRVQDVPEIAGQADPTLLEWASANGRIVLSHDLATIPYHVNQRLASGLDHSGVWLIASTLSIGRAIAALEFVIGASTQAEWTIA